jgi:vancomycin resistance protein YoaR
MFSVRPRIALFIVLVASVTLAPAAVASAWPQPLSAADPTSSMPGRAHDSSNMTLLGTWTTHYIPSTLNGMGVNIAVPAQRINGTIVLPGGTFDFIRASGPFTSPPYAMGGALRNGNIRTNILGGGMCSTVTTIFNAAVRAGLTIVERHPHSLYISRYPVGLDATVWGTPRHGQDMVFINDTGNPILITATAKHHKVTFEIWGTNDGRTVEFSDPLVENLVDGQLYFEYTDDLAAGQRTHVNDPYNSFDATVTRTVRDSLGNVIHQETYRSHYKLLNGLTMVGRYPGDPPAGTRVLEQDYPHPH